MATSCIDKILCENAWDCNITITDIYGNPIDPLKLNNGESVVIVFGEKIGYTFEGFVFDDGTPVTNYVSLGDNRYEIPLIDCSKQYLAKYRPIQYQVSITSDGGSNCFTDSIIMATYGDIVTISAQDSYGCHFLYWTSGDDVVSEERSFEYVVTGNVTFVAHYESIWYRITAVPNGRNRGTCSGTGNYQLNSTATISATANQGYDFSGWDDGDLNATRNVTVTESKTYKALFGKSWINVRVPSMTGGSVIGAGRYEYGSTVTLRAVPSAGWVFDYWNDGNNRYEGETLSFVSTGNRVIIPHFTLAAYAVRFVALPMGSGYIYPNPDPSYHYGDVVTVEAMPFSGYRFVEWADGVTEPRREITVTSTVDLVAKFEEAEPDYSLTASFPDSDYGCAIYYGFTDVATRNGNEFRTSGKSGMTFTFSPYAPEGMKLMSVSDGASTIWDASTGGIITYTMGNSNVELRFSYDVATYGLTVSASPINSDTSGNIRMTMSIDGVPGDFIPTTSDTTFHRNSIAYGTEIVLEAPLTVLTYSFAYWSTDLGTFSSSQITFNITENTKCVAVFQ